MYLPAVAHWRQYAVGLVVSSLPGEVLSSGEARAGDGCRVVGQARAGSGRCRLVIAQNLGSSLMSLRKIGGRDDCPHHLGKGWS